MCLETGSSDIPVHEYMIQLLPLLSPYTELKLRSVGDISKVMHFNIYSSSISSCRDSNSRLPNSAKFYHFYPQDNSMSGRILQKVNHINNMTIIKSSFLSTPLPVCLHLEVLHSTTLLCSLGRFIYFSIAP